MGKLGIIVDAPLRPQAKWIQKNRMASLNKFAIPFLNKESLLFISLCNAWFLH